jgi:hypothetical protein
MSAGAVFVPSGSPQNVSIKNKPEFMCPNFSGKRPRTFKLAMYIFLGLFAMSSAMFTAFNIYIKPQEWYRVNAVKILRNSGYNISEECIVGAHAVSFIGWGLRGMRGPRKKGDRVFQFLY